MFRRGVPIYRLVSPLSTRQHLSAHLAHPSQRAEVNNKIGSQNSVSSLDGESTRPGKRSSHSKAVVEIGPNVKPYRVSKDLITKNSEFFRNIFRKSWAEEQDQKVSLPCVELDVWEIFLTWIKTHRLPVAKWEVLEAVGYPRHKLPHAGPLHLDSYETRETVEIYFVKMIELGSYFGAEELIKKLHNGLSIGPSRHRSVLPTAQ
ncbi:hypothetical protein PSPO01_02950 [Paraphaeosphaeria sporulosa]